MTGTIVDLYPRASPYMMLVAGPVSQDVVNSKTGLYEKDVIYSVKAPITNPPHNPTNVQSHASAGVLLSYTYLLFASRYP